MRVLITLYAEIVNSNQNQTVYPLMLPSVKKIKIQSRPFNRRQSIGINRKVDCTPIRPIYLMRVVIRPPESNADFIFKYIGLIGVQSTFLLIPIDCLLLNG